jgi:hypothetical protein
MRKNMSSNAQQSMQSEPGSQAPSSRRDAVRETPEGSALESEAGPASRSRATEASTGQR